MTHPALSYYKTVFMVGSWSDMFSVCVLSFFCISSIIITNCIIIYNNILFILYINIILFYILCIFCISVQGHGFSSPEQTEQSELSWLSSSGVLKCFRSCFLIANNIQWWHLVTTEWLNVLYIRSGGVVSATSSLKQIDWFIITEFIKMFTTKDLCTRPWIWGAGP